MSPKNNTEVLVSVPEHKKAAMCLLYEDSVWDKPGSGTSTVPLPEFNANKLKTHVKQGDGLTHW
jgi:hypothetical protein